jgi:hypothetical protein
MTWMSARTRRGRAIVTPDGLLCWHLQRIARKLAAGQPWTYPARPPGRPSTATEIRRLIIDMATNNPT